jgi:hypothetical protein
VTAHDLGYFHEHPSEDGRMIEGDLMDTKDLHDEEPHMTNMHEHMDPRVWDHADNFTAHFMDEFSGEHNDHLHEQKAMFDKTEDEEKKKCKNCKCKKCIMKGSKFIMGMVIKKAKKVCSWKEASEWEKEGYEHGKMKKWFCMAFKKYPKVVIGYMAYKIRPVAMSM